MMTCAERLRKKGTPFYSLPWISSTAVYISHVSCKSLRHSGALFVKAYTSPQSAKPKPLYAMYIFSKYRNETLKHTLGLKT